MSSPRRCRPAGSACSPPTSSSGRLPVAGSVPDEVRGPQPPPRAARPARRPRRTGRSSRSSAASAARCSACAPGASRRSSTGPRSSRGATTREALRSPPPAAFREARRRAPERRRRGARPRRSAACARRRSSSSAPRRRVPEFLDALPHEVKTVVVGDDRGGGARRPNELLELVQPLEDAEAADEHEALERWREGAGTNGRAASGWADTLTLPPTPASICSCTRRARISRRTNTLPSADAVSRGGECPLDGTPRAERLGLRPGRSPDAARTAARCSMSATRSTRSVDGVGALLGSKASATRPSERAHVGR